MRIRAHISPTLVDGQSLYVVREVDGRQQSCARVGPTGEITWEGFDELGVLPPPTIHLRGPLAGLILAAIAHAIQFDARIPSDSESTARGKLEATERHLEDMRKLVFKAP